MGKGTDKLYITHSEWASEDAFGASAGAGVKQRAGDASFKRLPFKFCAVSLQPFKNPVCTAEGTIFDRENILSWLQKHRNNPINGNFMKYEDLVTLHFAKNEEGDYVDPVTYKVLTDNTHVVALKNTGNVFAYDTVERLNIKAKMWRDLVSDEEFGRKDIIVLQDPQNIESRDLSAFKYLKDGVSALTEEQERERHGSNVNASALGNASRILKAKEAVAAARAKRGAADAAKQPGLPTKASGTLTTVGGHPTHQTKSVPYNAAIHTTGKAAASFTSTGLTPHTLADRALLSEEDYMLKIKRVKHKGYARITTSLGDLTIELNPEFAPKAVWNFVTLAKKGYYDGIAFHRNIRNFMIQGGDPTGTGKGGSSCWGKNFADEFDGPSTHDARGVMSMANKGKDTNSSQFFILYRPAKHLDRKHTIFGRVIEGMDTLTRLENAEVTDKEKRPVEDIVMKEVAVYIDPFEEFRKERSDKEAKEQKKDEIRRQGGAEDERVTWTGKRIRDNGTAEQEEGGGVGKYLRAAMENGGAEAGIEEDEVVGEWEEEAVPEPPKKKVKSGGFGNFDSW
ncbi:MAG: Peptidyl-prolyl cis-trans isomerase cyp8 [Stictis urceolatum]|nr:Peptidyl-prolyl cis-trans isomerase cyp8 [Stictis urceolata]